MKVKFVEKDVYLGDVAKESLIQQIYFEKANFWQTDWSKVKPNINPLYWCLMDLIKVIYAPILALVIWPLVLFPSVVYSAIKARTWYSSDERRGVFVARAKWMEIEH